MIWLVLGVAVWCAMHLVPSIGLPLKSRLKETVGEKVYKIGFSVVIAVSIVLMVIGWRSTQPDAIYLPPDWTRTVTIVLMIAAFVLMGAAKHPTRIKRVIRHPQLTGVIVWAFAHLISNGDSRSIVLFGGLGLWALIEIPLINAREGTWVKPEAPSVFAELKGVAIGLLIFVAAMLLHPYFAGVSAIPG